MPRFNRTSTLSERGFTLLEILVSLAILAIVAVGAIGVLGAADAGGFLEGFPNAFATTRVARDYTAASVYLQALHEFVASKGAANAAPGTYCLGTACSPAIAIPPGLSGYPTPPGHPYQLTWQRLDVVIETWYWDTATGKYTSTVTANETIRRVRSTLTWVTRGVTRTLTVERFIL